MSSNKTPNYNLHAWTGDDFFKRSELNENFDTIDNELKIQKDKNAAQDAKLSEVETKANGADIKSDLNENAINALDSSIVGLQGDTQAVKYDSATNTTNLRGPFKVKGRMKFTGNEGSGTWSGEDAEVFQNADDATDNFGLMLKSGKNKAGNSMNLQLNPTYSAPMLYVNNAAGVQLTHSGIYKQAWMTLSGVFSFTATNTIYKLPFSNFYNGTNYGTKDGSGGWIAPEDGWYEISSNILWGNAAGVTLLHGVYTNGSEYSRLAYCAAPGYWQQTGGTFTIFLRKNDVVDVRAQVDTKSGASGVGLQYGGGLTWLRVTRIG